MDKKALSLPILISLVVGNMIGTGIYVLPASLAEFGTLALLGWIITSLGALFIALTLTSLNKRFPKTGGPYVYCKNAFGKLIGFIIAYTYWISYLASVAGLTVASVSYLGFITPVLNANSPAYSPFLTLFLQLTILWLFTLINIIGLHTAGVVQLYLTIIKIIPLILISIIGLAYVKLDNLVHLFNGQNFLTSIGGATTLTFWAFIGLESATVPAENTKGYKDIYKATMFGTLLTSILYIVSTFVLMGMIPNHELANSQFPFSQAGTILFGPKAAFLIALCAVISGLGSLNASILVQGQIVFAAARDHMFPHRFAKLSKYDVPVAAQLLSASLVTIFLFMTVQKTLLAQFNYIALMASLLTLLTYFATTIAELKFLAKDKQALTLSNWLIPILAALFGAWMILSFKADVLLTVLFLIIICIPIYYFTVRKYTEPHKQP